MRSSVFLGLLALAAEQAAAQAGAWAQCGGAADYTGPKTCIAGYYCAYNNPWYSQCLPGNPPASSSAAPTTTTVRSSTISTTTRPASTTTAVVTTSRTTTVATVATTTRVSTTTSAAASATVSGACPAWTAVTAAEAFKGLNPGWNLGNTLDAVPNEGSWNNPPATLATLQQVKAKGFKGIRIPVTWTHHFTSEGPNYTVDPAWMDRVEVVVDQALATGFWVVLNVHHDSWGWMDYAGGASIPTIEAKFAKLWDQIAARFKCKSSKLIFEAINEPTGTTEAHAIELNKLNDIFLTSINNAGGNNPKRVVTLSGLYMDSLRTTQWFKRGTLYPNQPWGLQFHYYSPYDFIFNAWGRTIWGSDADKALLTSEFEQVAGNFTGVPVVIGEWDASTINTEPAARWKYFDYLVKEANRLGFATILWDNGLDHFLRPTNTWIDESAIDILFKTTGAVKNALADSTTDQSATSQSSSAYIWHKVGAAVTSQSVKYTLNGNTLVSIKTATGAVVPTSSYTFASDGTLTLTQAYLSTLYSATAAPGTKAVLTLEFTPGADLTLTIIQYNTPTAPTSTYSLSTLQYAFTVPINWAGLPAIAAIKALKADGTYFQDEWTQYLGPLQQARWTYGNWIWSPEGLVIYEAGVTQLKAAGQAVTLTLEFFPRTLGENSLTLQFNP